MHETPCAKTQANQLKLLLRERGVKLAHQDALEAIARMNGHKSWKHMAAGTPRRVQRAEALAEKREVDLVPVQSEVPGPVGGRLFRIPVTVDVTQTAAILVRGNSAEEAIELARKFAHESYPQLFALDEGNYRGLPDFYVGDEQAVEPLEPSDTVAQDPSGEAIFELESLSLDLFDEDDFEFTSNGGMSGEFSCEAKAGDLELCAQLSPYEPDNSNDDRRSRCCLDVQLKRLPSGELLASYTQKQYVYGGEDRGDHLADMMNDGTLFELLQASAK